MIKFRFAKKYEEFVQYQDPLASVVVIMDSIEQFILKLSDTILVVINRDYLFGASISQPNEIITWFNNQPYHALPTALALTHNAVIRTHLGDEFSIYVTNAPLPYTADTRLQLLQLSGTLGFQLPINICFAMGFVAAFYVLTYIRVSNGRERSHD